MTTIIKNILKQYFSNLYYFYAYLKYRIFVLLILTLFVGLLDGLGISMFLPLLQMVSENSINLNDSNFGNLSFIVNGLNNIGVDITLLSVIVVMLVFFVLKGLFVFYEAYLNAIYQQYFIRTVRIRTIDLLSDYRYDKFILEDAGRIQNTMSGEITRVVQSYRMYLEVIKSTVTILVYTGLAFLANPEFALIVFIGSMVTNLFFKRLYKKTKKLSEKLVESSHDFQGLLIQQVSFFKYLKATGLIKLYGKKLKNKITDIADSEKKMGVLNAIMIGIREPVLISVVVIVILIQIFILGGNLGLIILSILFFYRALQSVMLLQTIWNKFLSFSGSIENLKAFISEISAGKRKNGGVKFYKLEKNMEFKKLDFFYNKPILKNIDLIINKNETIAVVGESGAGKTTLVNVISGLLNPIKGEILVDNLKIKDLEIDSYCQRIGYITQEPVIFDDTVFNNVTFWDEKNQGNVEKCYAALQKASIKEFVMQLSDKEDSRLGNNGINLSGGQKQRISIARELYKDIDILIMDEATSSLDSETEKIIKENIDMIKGKYTIIIVSHRLSTIKNADRIILMKDGEIIQTGSYEELILKGTDFKKMVEMQEV